MSKFQVSQEVYYIDCYGRVNQAKVINYILSSCRENCYNLSIKDSAIETAYYEDKLFATELEAYQQLAKQIGEQSAEVQNRINALQAIKLKEAEELLAKEQKAEPRYSLIADSNNAYKLSVSEAIQLVVITGIDNPDVTLSGMSDFYIIDHKEFVHPKLQIKNALDLAENLNRGEKFVVITHSDYFIRTLNNLMLICDNNLDPELYGYKANQLFSSKVMLSFEADEHGKLTDYNVNGNEGIECNSIDEVIWDEVDKTRAIIKAVDE